MKFDSVGIARKSTTEVWKFEELLETTKRGMRQDKRVKYSRHKNFVNESKTLSQIIQYRFLGVEAEQFYNLGYSLFFGCSLGTQFFTDIIFFLFVQR